MQTGRSRRGPSRTRPCVPCPTEENRIEEAVQSEPAVGGLLKLAAISKVASVASACACSRRFTTPRAIRTGTKHDVLHFTAQEDSCACCGRTGPTRSTRAICSAGAADVASGDVSRGCGHQTVRRWRVALERSHRKLKYVCSGIRSASNLVCARRKRQLGRLGASSGEGVRVCARERA